MEDFIEDLKKYAEPTRFPLELPSEEDLVEVEEQIFLPLPRSYREFLLSASDLILGTMEPCTAADRNSHTYLPEVTAEAWSTGLPRDVFPICTHAEGYYCINPTGAILLWVNNGYEKGSEWEDIWEWITAVWRASASK